MVRAEMARAKELIEAQRYDEARTLLKTVNHPLAREWEAKLDKMAPHVNALPGTELQGEPAMSRPSEIYVLVTPFITYTLIAINAAVFFFLAQGQAAYTWGATNQFFVFHFGEYYRLVTAMFLHANLIHLLLNMYALFVVGRVLEEYYGHHRFLVIYLLGGLAGSITSSVLGGPDVVSVGASGAVFALFGAALVFYSRYRELLSEDAEKGMRWAGQAAAINILNGLRPDAGIDNWAHVGGLVGGVVICWVVNALFRLRYDLEQFRVVAEENHPRTFTAIFAATFGLVVMLGVTALPGTAPRTITAQNVSLSIPGGWHVVPNFDGEPYCEQAGVNCLIGVISSSGVGLELVRFSGLAVLLSSPEDFNQLVTRTMTAEGGQLHSRQDIQLAGRKVIQSLYENGGQTHLFIFVEDGTTILRLHAQGIGDSFTRDRDELDAVIASLLIAD